MSNFETEQEQENQKETIIGDYKPKRKFLNFVSAVNGARIRYIRDIAFVKGEKLSGMLEGAIFKITICDEGTIKFEEQEGTNLSDPAMIQRLIDEIDSTDITGYAQKFVVSGIEFADVDGGRCYLEVEHDKPIDKLKSLFDEDESQEISERGLSILDDLFSGTEDVEPLDLSESDVEAILEEIENPSEPNDALKSAAQSYMEESFRKMNEQKIEELKGRIEDHHKEIAKQKTDASRAESKIKENKDQIRILESRLDSLEPSANSNGYVFFVSEQKKHETGLDESTRHVADKIADIMGLKKEALFDMLTGGYHIIKIAKKGSDYAGESLNKKIESEEEIEQIKKDMLELQKMQSLVKQIDADGEFSLGEDGITYQGSLNWHQLVGKMIKKGFEQDPDFDKAAGSNSYTKDEEEEGFAIEAESHLGIETDESSDESEEADEEYHSQKLIAFDEPTDVILWSAPDTASYSDADVTITDDFWSLDVRIGGKPTRISFETAGFASATTFKEYEKYLKKNGTEELGGTSAILIPNFQGEIRVGVELDNGGYAKAFDPNDDIAYAQGGGAPFLDFPEGTTIVEIDEDHDISKLKGFLRDKKITSLGI